MSIPLTLGHKFIGEGSVKEVPSGGKALEEAEQRGGGA